MSVMLKNRGQVTKHHISEQEETSDVYAVMHFIRCFIFLIPFYLQSVLVHSVNWLYQHTCTFISLFLQYCYVSFRSVPSLLQFSCRLLTTLDQICVNIALKHFSVSLY
jgi:hypothetical protein